jgi:hypothetical protein
MYHADACFETASIKKRYSEAAYISWEGRGAPPALASFLKKLGEKP